MSNVATRKTADLLKLEELIDKKLSTFVNTLASKEGINELKSLFKDLNEKIANQNNTIRELTDKINSQDKLISNLEDKVGVLSASVSAIKVQADGQEQYSRRACLRIKGITGSPNESAKDCVQRVIEVCRDTNVLITHADIDRAHRIGKDRKTMIVKFHSFGKRSALYKTRKNLKNGIKIHLDITKARLNILDDAKKLITNDSTVDFVFADINCNIVAKLKDGNFKFFDNIVNFRKLL